MKGKANRMRQDAMQHGLAFPFASLSQAAGLRRVKIWLIISDIFLSPVLWQWPMAGSDGSSNLVHFSQIFSEVTWSCAHFFTPIRRS
jgi:hypothetical protein